MDLGPRGVGRILDEAFRVFGLRFGYHILVVASIWIPFSLASELLIRSRASGGLPLLLLLVPIPARILCVSLLAPVATAEILGRPPALGEAAVRVLSRLPGILWIMLLTTMLAIPLACLCVLPMYVGLWALGLAPVVLLCEPARGALRAVGRGFFLVKGWGSFARWLGYSSVAGLLFLPTNLFSSLIGDATVRSFFQTRLALGGSALELLAAVLSGLFLALSSAFLAICTCVYYLDQRVRKEGLDLEVTLDRWIARPAAGRSAGA